MSPERLIYGLVEMRAEPINGTLEQIAAALHNGHPVIAELEPGDATYYNLLISPAWGAGIRGSLGRFGIPLRAVEGYLIVTKLTDTGGITFYVTDRVGTWDLEEHIRNPWTRELLVWWLLQLWDEIKKGRHDAPATDASAHQVSILPQRVD